MDGEAVPILLSTEPEAEPHAAASAFIDNSNRDSRHLPKIGSARLARIVKRYVSSPLAGGSRTLYRFNWVFFKRFYRILRVIFPKLRSATLAFFVFLLFTGGAGH